MFGMRVKSLSIFVDDVIAPLLSQESDGGDVLDMDKNWWRKRSAWDAAADSAEAVGTGTVLMSVVMRTGGCEGMAIVVEGGEQAVICCAF